MIETLNLVEQDIYRRLSSAANDQGLPMHTPVVGMTEADLRIMILRQ